MLKLEDFRAVLEQFFFGARSEKQKLYDRTLPLGDYVVDRWEKAEQLGFGAGSSVYDNVIILGRPKVGSNVWVGPNVILDASGGLEIGDNCNISAGVQIYSHDSVERCVSGGKLNISTDEVVIGSNCYIGPNSVIAKGVKLGDGCVVGALSFVNQSFPAGSRVAGQPARLLSAQS